MKIRVFETIVFAAFLFVLALLITTIFSPNKILAAVVAIAGVVFFWMKFGTDSVKAMENVYETLKERLSTAKDNTGVDNPIVDSLIDSVSADLDMLGSSPLLNTKRNTALVLGVIVICFLLLMLNVVGFRGIDVGSLLGNGGPSASSGKTGGSMSESQSQGGRGKEELKFGEESIAKVEGENVPIYLAPEYGGEGENNVDNRELEQGVVDVLGAPQDLYTEDIPTEYEDIVREYFERMSKNG